MTDKAANEVRDEVLSPLIEREKVRKNGKAPKDATERPLFHETQSRKV